MNMHTAAFVALALAAGCESEPEHVDAPFGAPCEGNEDCESRLCLNVGTSFCTRECADDCTCPTEMVCAAVGDGLSVCAPGASSCEMPEEDAGTPAIDAGFMPPLGRPGALCNSSADCEEVWSRGGTGPSAEGMYVPQECFTTIPGGYCSMTECEENFRRDPCSTGTGCYSNGRGGICLIVCDDGPSECRDGWACRTDLDAANPLCWPPCSDTGCRAGLDCAPNGSCVEPGVIPVEYDVTTRSVALDVPLSPVDGMATLGDNLPFMLPFAIRFYGVVHAAGSWVVASWQGLFALARSTIAAYTPGDHVRYEPAAPLIVAHHYENSSGGGSVSYRVSGTAPSRTLEVEWVTTNLSGTGGARFRLRFNEGVNVFVVHYGPISDDTFPGTWTQLAMRDATHFEEVIVSTGAPAPASRANTEFTYTPR